MVKLLEEANSKQAVTNFFETLDSQILLKLHKYFFWADKKLHSVFFIEDKDNISEDLLVDFKDENDQKAFVQS